MMKIHYLGYIADKSRVHVNTSLSRYTESSLDIVTHQLHYMVMLKPWDHWNLYTKTVSKEAHKELEI